ncbi:N-terminal double-transmembrane domain-containing protein [Verrucomicrobium sp. GAS474]|uniref:BatA domain-containing protein n=1 Tax=Verrucomicrobium sp. GAS474 TaxID=1882831 RepID=UPI00087B9886|nr:BatA domain-containing protein [Verrucomicrobium sp. GAS474]SDU12856.1 N-terminal double-transmembrane domain-containing protein [Verrucomicrobium sp. GAS474]
MSWLLPGFLAGALAIGLPIALHFLRSKPTVVIPFPTLRFLGPTALRETKRNRLRRWLTLLLRCLAIALLAAAFARPFWASTPSGGGKAVLVVVDNSMSMQASGRWESLKSQAVAALDGLQPGDRAGVLLMNPSSQWLVPMGDQTEAARNALRALQPGYETTRCQGALRLAGDVLSRQPEKEKRLFWMSDEQRLGWAGTNFGQALPPGVKLNLTAPRPEPASQAAITGVTIKGEAPAFQAEVTIRLYTPASEARERTITIFEMGSAGKVVGKKTVSLNGREPASFTVPLDLPPGPSALPAGLRVELDPDDLPADDRFYLSLGGGGQNGLSVSLDAVPGVDYLAHALHAAKLPAGAPQAQALPGGEAEWPRGIAVLRGEEAFLPPQAAKLERFLRNGGSLWIFADGGPAQAGWLKARGVVIEPLPLSPPASDPASAGDPRHLRDWDPEHPLLAAFVHESLLPLLQAEFRRPYALRVSPAAADRIAAWDEGSPAVVELSAAGPAGPGASAGGRILLCGFGLSREETDWPMKASFVPFVDQAIRWLAAAREGRRAWQIGETIPLSLSLGAGEGKGSASSLWTALDTPRPVPPQRVGNAVRPTVPGLYRYDAGDGTPSRIFAVNVPTEESDLAPWPESEVERLTSLQSKKEAEAAAAPSVATTRLSDETEEARQRFWWWLMAGAALCLLGELTLANRTSAS